MLKKKNPLIEINHSVITVETQSTHTTREKRLIQEEKNDCRDYHIYPTPLLGQDMTQSQFLSGV